MMPRARRLFVLTLLLATSSCASLAGRGDWDPFRSAQERRVTVTVLNQGVQAVSVVAAAPGRRTALGTVEGGARIALFLPLSEAQEVRFELQTVGSARFTMTPIPLVPGGRVELLVREPLRLSTARR